MLRLPKRANPATETRGGILLLETGTRADCENHWLPPARSLVGKLSRLTMSETTPRTSRPCIGETNISSSAAQQ